MKKRLFCLALSLTFILGLLPTAVLASGDDETEPDSGDIIVISEDTNGNTSSESDGGSGGESGDGSSSEILTNQLYVYDVWYGPLWFTENLPAGNDWHGYFTFHAEEGESSFAISSYESIKVSGDTVVTVTAVSDIDPIPENLTWTKNLYHIEVTGVGVAALKVTAGDAVYTINVVVSEEPDEEPSDETASNQLYMHDVWYGPWFTETLSAGNDWHGYFTFHAEEGESSFAISSYESIKVSGDTVVTITAVSDTDPIPEDLTWTENLYHIEVIGVGVATLKVTAGDAVYAINVVVSEEPDEEPGGEPGGETALPTITLNGVEYTVGLGDAKSNNYDFITFLGGHSNLGCGPDMTYFVAAMSGYGTENETEAPALVYEYITKVNVELKSYTNLDTSGDQTTPNVGYTCSTMNYHGGDVPTITVSAADGDYFVSNISVNITIKDPQTSEETTYSLTYNISYTGTFWFDLDFSNLNTAEKLNAVLSSDTAFETWIKQNEPGKHESIVAATGDVNIRVKLPAITYDGVITANVSNKFANIFLDGTRGENESCTTLPGLRVCNILQGVRTVDFVAADSIVQAYGSNSFTCGILVAGESYGEVLQTEDCNFTGFDYGIHSTDHGIATGVYRCQFIDCVVGFYMDSYNSKRSQMYGTVQDSRFVNNQTAVQIVSLKSDFAPYNFRVKDCDFIGIDSTCDFQVETSGTFYFYRNYYGTLTDTNHTVEPNDITYRTARAQFSFIDNDTIIVTNPRRILPCTFNLGDERLCIDPTVGLYTVILNSMADELIIDAESLENLESDVEITVSNDKEEELGKWSFDQKKGNKSNESIA